MDVGRPERPATRKLQLAPRTSFDSFYVNEYRPLLRLAWSLTGRRDLGISGPSHANLAETDHVLFLGTIAPEHRNRPIAVVTTSPTGEKIRLDVPATP